MLFLPDVGDVFSGCQILARCGNGTYGITFLARNPLGEKVIIKIVSNQDSYKRELTGLRNYMRVAGKHPNLLQIYHIGEHENSFYYTMEAADNIGSGSEYIPATLGNLFRQGKRFSPEEAVAITRELADGLRIMHEMDLIHRDIKPDNIIFVNGKAKLSDPGLVVSLGEQASFAGTPGFIPPELIKDGGTMDQQSDIYALGKVFYCLATGQAPKCYPQLPDCMRTEVSRQIYPALIKMCNNRPEKRCKNIEELLNILPVKLADPTRLDRWREDFRNWKQLNERQYKYCKLTAVLLLVCLMGCTGGLIYQKYHNSCRQKRIISSLEKFNAVNSERQELVLLQLEVYLPDKAAEYNLLKKRLSAAAAGRDFRKIEQTLEKIQTFLAAAAVSLIPELPVDCGNMADDCAAIGKMHGFLAAPLAEYLPAERRENLKKQLEKFEHRIYRDWSGLRCGKDLENMQYYYVPLKFLPPGATRMYHTGKTAVVPYHFWIGKNEVIGEDVAYKLGISPQFFAGGNRPVERISWNDVLYYCYTLTVILKNNRMLPENYIVRPPNEVEWEYAANNGWLGKDTIPLAERANTAGNSQKRTWAAGRMQPSKLGLNDIYGNVAEIVQPVDPPRMQQSVIVRGGSFTDKLENCNRRIEYLKYQNIPHNIGFRLAVAPGDMSYFDREIFLGGAVQTVMRGKVYELIGANYGSFTWHSAEKLCRLLGGRLAEIEDPQHLSDLRKALPLTGKWATFLGGVFENGQWLWYHSRRQLDFGKWKRTKHNPKDKHLTLIGNQFDSIRERRSSILLCEWNEKDYEKRNSQLVSGEKLPFEICRFDYKGRRYMLLKISCHWLVAKRICELLGGSLAVLDSDDVKAHVIKTLQHHSNHRIILGGFRKYDKWYWLNGKITEAPKDDLFGRGGVPTVNLNCITLYNNILTNNQTGCMFLCEWRLSSDSSL